jgi:Histidine kinase-, DNA gyrase B-, and HSP90-like ATPase
MNDRSQAPASFQQAKNPAQGPQFLQIVAKPELAAGGKPATGPAAKLTRVAFKVSRLMEFCTRRELVNQTGHSIQEWPLVAVKELVDNSLDACEEAEVAPSITVTVEPGVIVVEDNGDGIDAETVASVLDYTVRVSSREAYCAPTRGAQGNALKTILAMGYVIAREIGRDAEAAGVTIVEARGVKHRIEFRVDHINNQPKIVHTTTPSEVETGTRFTVQWPPEAKLLAPERQWSDAVTDVLGPYPTPSLRFRELVEAYVWLNPHLTLRGIFFGAEFVNAAATRPDWDKWRPRNPTSAHWYDEARLQRYLAAHVSRDRDLGHSRTVREFISEFRGLSGTAVQRKILTEIGCSHQSLASFFGVERVNQAGVAELLAAMKRHSKPVKPAHLGIIGSAHLKERFLAAGGAAETFKYERRNGTNGDSVPYLVEFAFGLHQAGLQPRPGVTVVRRKIVTGANFSAAIGNPFRRFGSTGEGLDSTLQKVRANASSPVICVLHLASAHLQYADRGKSSIILTDEAEQPDD